MRAVSQAFAVFLASAILVPAVAEPVTEHGPFVVEGAVLEGLAGTLEVRPVEGAEARLVVRGPADARAALEVAVSDRVLRVKAQAGGHSVTVVERVTVVTGPGASSNVVIGGSAASASAKSGAAAPLDLVLDLPVGARLELAAFTGEAAIGDLLGPVRLEVVGGVLRAGAVREAELAAIGDGSIEVAAVDGDLTAGVTGAGRIVVRDGTLAALRVDVTGSGSVVVEAAAETAVVNMIGAGEVRLAAVATPPEVNRVGAGRFSVGEP